MKKVLITILIVLIVIVSVVILVVGTRAVIIEMFDYSSTWAYSADYENYSDEFGIVKDYLLDQYSYEYEKMIVVSTANGGEKGLFDPDSKKNIDISDEVKVALKTICDFGFPYKDSVLDVVRIHGNTVSFCIENGRYALIYSPDEKPSWLSFISEEGDMKVKKIKNGWYHVIEASQ